MATIAEQVKNFKKSANVDIEQITAEYGVPFSSLDEKVQSAILSIAASSYFNGGEPYLR
jgi:hypothetical protein